MQTYLYCVICGNAQKVSDLCTRCGSIHLAEREVQDYEVHLNDQVKIVRQL